MLEEFVDDRERINGYFCRKCGKISWQVLLIQGVTPMFLGCRFNGCGGPAGVSMMFPWSRNQLGGGTDVPALVLRAVRFEWYYPSEKEMAGMSPSMLDHVRAGGLDIRPLTDDGRLVIEQMLKKVEP